MKKLKFILAFSMLLAGVAAVGAVASNNDVKKVEAAETYEKITSVNDLQDGSKIVITATSSSKVYYVPNASASNGGVSGKTLTLTNNAVVAASDMIWNVKVSGTSFKFESDAKAGNYLSMSNTNNGVSVGTKTDVSTTYSVSISSGYFKIKANSNPANGRFLALYSQGPNWRCYSSSSGVQNLTIYKLSGSGTAATSYTVAFDAGTNGTCATKTQDVTIGESINLPTVTPNEGWEFDGWYLDGKKVESPFTPTGSCTLVAQYSFKLEEGFSSVVLNNANTYKATDTTYKAGKSTVSGVDFSWFMAGDKASIQLRSKNSEEGIVSTSTIGNIRKIILEWHDESTTGRKLNVYGSNSPYSTVTSLYNSSTSGALLGSITKGTSSSLDINGDYAYVGLRSSADAMYIKSIQLIYENAVVEDKDTYFVNFNANGGAFADSEEWGAMECEGERTVVLPIASDLETTAYKYTTLVGWTDGTNTYAPGASVVVDAATTFTAVYEAPELITIAQALEICALTGTTDTTYAFTVEGVVSELNDSGVSQYGNFDAMLTDSTGSIKIFRVKCDKTAFDLANGDTIRVTGALVNYQSNTPEFVAGTTYVFVSRPLPPEPTLEEKLAEFTTNASVGFSYTKSGEDYTFSNVRLSFRGTISAELYEEVVAAGVSAAGIEVSIEGQEPYTIDCTTSIGTDANGNKYVFGSLLVPEGKENIVVTGKAFVTVDGARLYLASTAHSLVSAVSAYLGDNAPALTAEQLEAVTALAASLGIAA